MALSDFLQSLGLDETTQKVYLVLLRRADATASQIARAAGVNRTSCYHILENLHEKGLISVYKEKGEKRFFAENPAKIRGLIEGQLKAFEKHLPDLLFHAKGSVQEPEVRIFHGAEGIRAIDDEILQYKEEELFSIGSAKIIQEALGKNIGFSRRRESQKIISFSIRPESERHLHTPKPLSHIRYLPVPSPYPGMIHIFHNNVAILSSKKDGLHLLVQSADLAQFFRQLFDHLWEIATP